MENTKSPGRGDARRDDQAADDMTSSDDASLTEYDKTIADSFPSSDPPATP